MEYQARWVALLAIVIVVGAFGALLIDRRTRVWGAGLIVAGIFGLLLFALFSVHQVRSGVSSTERMSQAFQSASGQVEYGETPAVPLPPGYASDAPTIVVQQNGIALLPLLLIGGTVGLLIALALRGRLHIHGHLAGLGGLAIAAVMGVGLLLFLLKPVYVDRQSALRQEAESARMQREAMTRIHEAASHEPSATHKDVIPARAEAEENPKTAKIQDTQPKTWREMHYDPSRNPSSSETSSSKQPSWLDEQPHRDGDIYFIVVQSDTYLADPNSRQRMFEEKMVAAVGAYIDDLLLRQPGATQAIDPEGKFLLDFLQEFITDRCYYPSGEQALRLGLNNRFRTEIEHRWKQFLSVDRVEKVAGIGLAGFLLLGGLYTYLRMTPASKHSPPLAAAAGQSVAAATSAEPNSTPTSKIGEAASQWHGYFSYWTFWILIGLLVLGVLAALGLMR